MSDILQAIRGMNDVLPPDTPLWQWLEAQTHSLFSAYGYSEIRLPLLEHTSVFTCAVGTGTDIVEKEMYSFADRNGDSLSLRPEGTAGCLRAALEHGLLHNQTPRLWYAGAMFRHERPQQGRYRQFHQIGAEAYGLPGPDIDAEMILLTARLWRLLGIGDVTLHLNSLGSSAARAAYRDKLVDYFSKYENDLDPDNRRRLKTNPLRILDSKNNPAKIQLIIQDAPRLIDSLDTESREHFDSLKAILKQANVTYQVNPLLVRGLDYYTKTVFEWITGSLGAQGTVCAGGRYDGLVEQFGGKPTPAVGFAMGVERLVALIQAAGKTTPVSGCDAYLMPACPAALPAVLTLAENLREHGWRVISHCGGGSLKSQFKRADKSGARYGMVIGEDELAAGKVTVKWLREEGRQQTLALAQVAGLIAA